MAFVAGDTPDAGAARALAIAAGAQPVSSGPADVLVADEWTAEDDPRVVAARASGARVTTLAELIFAQCEGRWVGVTGTAGKSSTCHALDHILRHAGCHPVMSRTARSANAWPDASLARSPTRTDEILIAELTSTHLCHMDAGLTPDVAVVTLVRPDHPDLHPSHEAYVAAKRRLWDGLGARAAIVLPADDPETRAVIGPVSAEVWGFGEGDPGSPGAFRTGPDTAVLRDRRSEHQVPRTGASVARARATMAAAAAAMALGVAAEVVAMALPSLPVAPHRQHLVGRFRDALIIDDTMAATPLKALRAVHDHAGVNPVLVIGGDAVDHSHAEIAEALDTIRSTGLRVVAFGSAGPTVAARVDVLALTPTVMGALATAATAAGAGGTVLVTPMFPMDPVERVRVAELPEP